MYAEIYNNKFSLNYKNTSDIEEYLTYLLERSLWSDTPTPDLAAILPAPLETYSFRTGIQPRQLALINIGVAAIGALGILQPVLTALALSCVFLTLFSALILFRLVLVLTGLGLRLSPVRHMFQAPLLRISPPIRSWSPPTKKPE